MPPVGFEPTISAGEQPQTYALDLAATETDTPEVLHRHPVRPIILFLLIKLTINYYIISRYTMYVMEWYNLYLLIVGACRWNYKNNMANDKKTAHE